MEDGVKVFEAVEVTLGVTVLLELTVFDGVTVEVSVCEDVRLLVIDKVWLRVAVCEDVDEGVIVFEVVPVTLGLIEFEGVPELEPDKEFVVDGDTVLLTVGVIEFDEVEEIELVIDPETEPD